MATTASPCVRSVTIPRCTTDSDWGVTDIDVRGNKLAVCGYNNDRTETISFIDLFTLNDPDSSSPLMTQLCSKLFDLLRWPPYRCVSFLDDSRIVTVRDDLVQVYHIEADDIEPLHTVNLLHDKSAKCITVREEEIFIGLDDSNEVIVFDFSLNEIKTITLERLVSDYPEDITVYGDNLFISTCRRSRAIRYNMEGKIVHEYKSSRYSFACSITVSGLVYILWDWLHVVVYSLSDSQQLMSFDVDKSDRIRIVDVNRLLTVHYTGEVREYSMNTLQLAYPRLIGALTVLLSKNDCHQLARHVALPKYQLDAIINSDSSAKDLLDILEERGVIHTSNVSRLLEAISVLKINEKALFMLERYQRSRGDETSYGRFLAVLSSHLLLSLPRKLCDYFKFTNEKKEAVITSQTPGISFLLTLEDMGVINPFDVGKLVTPLKQYQLVQAVAKVQEYQTLVDERSELKKPIHTLEGKQTLFIECLRKKTKSWYETMTPLPWKKSCKWMTSELFIACGLVLTDSKSKMKTTDVDQECKLKYTDILTHRRLKSATRIIIEGDPGSGKTMLSSQLAYDWSVGKSSDARMVVFLPLKFVDGMTIIEAIKQFYIPKGKPLNEGDIKAILDQASDERKTCIVLDGLEEYNGRTKDGEPSEVERVMRKEKFPNCTVVLTSRSDFVHDLPRCPMLKLGRFGEEERDQYIANIIPDDREKQQKVKCSVETSALLFDLCSNPLLFVYIVHNIEHLGQIDKPKGQLDSVGPFMEVMVNTLLSLSRSEHSESSESEIMSKSLSEIAFNGLCKGYQQLMWQKSFLNENVSNVKDWIESGILVVEEGVMAREEKHRNKEEAVEEGMVTQDEVIYIDDERREGESSSEAAMIGEGQDDILSIDEECPRDTESSTDNKLNEKEKPFTEMKTSNNPHNLSVQGKSLHTVIQERFADDERREGESSSEAAMIGEGQDDILSIDEENPSDRGSSTDNKLNEKEKPFTERKTTTDLQNLSLQVKFLHKVIQEWFAAKHFSSMLQRSKGQNRHRLFLDRHLPLINPADLHYVLRFTSYLCPENCYLIMEHLHSCYESQKGVVPEYILNCIFLCFIECNTSVRNKRMDNPVRQVCKNIVTIRGGDSRILQQSKVSMLMYAANSKIRIGTLRLVDLIVEVTKATLTFNSNITLECFPTLKVIEVSRWDMRLKVEDFEELIKFITQCKLLNKAFLNFPSPPPSLTGKTLLSSMKKNLTIEWIIGDRIVHTLDKKSGEWPMQFRSTPHQITDFSQPGPSKSSAHSGKTKKAKERTLTPKSVQKQDTEEPGSITTKKKHVNTGSQQIVQTPQITKILTQGETAYQVMFKSLRVMLIVNKEGGRLDIPDTGASLEIPSGALEGEQLIQMIIPPHLESESLTFASNSSLVVELLPSNLNLMKPAILTLPHCLVLKKGCEWKAKIYRSHHKDGSEPQWEEQSNTHYKLGEHNCVIEIQRFSWEKFEVDAQIVEAKNIIMYAAGRCCSPDTIYLDIGYYLNLATFEEVSKRNNASLLHEQPTVFYNNGKHLKISLKKFTPMNWTCRRGEKKTQAISFNEVAIAPWIFRIFVLHKTEPKGTDACTCYCKAGQVPDLQNFIFQFKAPEPASVNQPSTSNRQEAARAGTSTAGIEAPDLVVATATIQDLSHKFCDEWRIVGSKLGIGEPKLQTIDTDNRTAQEKVYQMLLTWKQSKGNEATYILLGEALQSAGRKDLQEYLYQQDLRDQQIKFKHKNEDRERSSSKYHLEQKDVEDREKKRVSRKRKRAKHKHHEVKRKSNSPQRKHKHHKLKRKSTSPQMERAKHKHHKFKRKSVSPQRKRAKQYQLDNREKEHQSEEDKGQTSWRQEKEHQSTDEEDKAIQS
ncbi:uncharacterized protein [Apostichopus japonicus]|uniref:uncharacterized protein isoform X2 n=1 Tax=Stichopus japonicus TaxID=307972 RepID=UPI003AB3AB94